MSNPVPVAPLVPRGAKQAKKKRPGFRPVGKSSKSPARQKVQFASSQEWKEPPLPITGSDAPFSREDEDEIFSKPSEKESPEEKLSTTEQANEETEQKLPATAMEQEMPKAPPPKLSTTITATIRKRKQSTSISAGFRSNSTPSSSINLEQPSNKKNVPSSITRSKLSEETSPRASSFRAYRSSSRKSTALVVTHASAMSVPVAPSQDRDILERMVAETTDAVRLNSFCSTFKGEKEPRRRRGAGSQTVATGNAANTTTFANRSKQKGSNTDDSNNCNSHNSSKRNAPDTTGAPVVQVIDGEIVLQESSLLVPGQRRTVQEVEEEFQDVVEEDAQLAIVGASYSSFINRKGPQHWTLKETERFFEGLRQLGTDFCSMEAFFENRSRKQLKRKYRTELIRNPALVEMALDPRNKTNVDMSIFDVEVDPKAIEAAAHDEPPEYIPTDGASAAMKEIAATDFPPAPDENTGATVITADALATAAAIAATTANNATTDPSAIATTTTNMSNLDKWKAVVPLRDEEEEDIHYPEPSMDDFFHDEED